MQYNNYDNSGSFKERRIVHFTESFGGEEQDNKQPEIATMSNEEFDQLLENANSISFSQYKSLIGNYDRIDSHTFNQIKRGPFFIDDLMAIREELIAKYAHKGKTTPPLNTAHSGQEKQNTPSVGSKATKETMPKIATMSDKQFENLMRSDLSSMTFDEFTSLMWRGYLPDAEDRIFFESKRSNGNLKEQLKLRREDLITAEKVRESIKQSNNSIREQLERECKCKKEAERIMSKLSTAISHEFKSGHMASEIIDDFVGNLKGDDLRLDEKTLGYIQVLVSKKAEREGEYIVSLGKIINARNTLRRALEMGAINPTKYYDLIAKYNERKSSIKAVGKKTNNGAYAKNRLKGIREGFNKS